MITLQTINTSPRVFRIRCAHPPATGGVTVGSGHRLISSDLICWERRNFLSDEEATAVIDEALSIKDDMYKLQRSGTVRCSSGHASV